MDLSTSLIDIDSVEADNREAEFTPEKKVALESLAHSIVNLKGLITIPIVTRIGIESYKLISGHFEYYAFIKALELDSTLPDRIRVFIIDDENIQPTLEQLKAVENIRLTYDNGENTTLLELGNIKSIIQSLEKNLTNRISIESNQVRSEVLQNFQDRLPKPLPPLEAFNHISDPIVYSEVLKKIGFLGKTKAQKLADRLKEIKNPEHNRFRTFGDVLAEIGKGYLSKEKMLDIIDNW
ncbi:MAG: hypothetical protein JOZ78_11265 [Chroococcidiopsidaceae cyanobacterium CP_BM_ER_R8_30]|nr:hypothetical protein [Chroococcidiopsidaceae cyanobacterium CP_BM_ER_R8_30]